MGKVRNILEEKGTAVYSIEPTETVYRALDIMMEVNIGGLLVTEKGRLVGIFTERDYARKLILKGRSSINTLVKDLMTPDPITVTPETEIEVCMKIMTTKHIRHLPVEVEGHLVGVISIGDVVRSTIQEQLFIIEHLEQYIAGR